MDNPTIPENPKSPQNAPAFRHLTDDKRFLILEGLNARHSFADIAQKAKVARQTISREIRRNRVPWTKGASGRGMNCCVHRRNCSRIQLCEDKPDCLRKCSLCRLCNTRCPDYEEERCPKLDCPPYVCNGCQDRPRCTLRKYVYDPKAADRIYRELLSNSRKGANVSEAELDELDQLISPRILKGQSIHHIFVTEPGIVNVCEKTIRNYLNARLFTARRGDLPRACRLRKRRRKPQQRVVEQACRQGRTYRDYLAYRDAHHHLPIAQTDTVIGRIGGKTLLSIVLMDCDLLILILLEHNTSDCVTAAYQDLAKRLRAHGIEPFTLFPILLTDRGTEFSAPSEIETFGTPERPIRVFYCDACSPHQKGSLERTHEDPRAILPKGTNFDPLIQDDVDRIASHLNSHIQPDLGDRTPIQVARQLYGQALLDALRITEIPPRDVIRTPALIADILEQRRKEPPMN